MNVNNYVRRQGFPRLKPITIWNDLAFGYKIDETTIVEAKLYVRFKRKYPLLKLEKFELDPNGKNKNLIESRVFAITVDEALEIADGRLSPYEFDADTNVFRNFHGKRTHGEPNVARAFAIEKIFALDKTRTLTDRQRSIVEKVDSPIFNHLCDRWFWYFRERFHRGSTPRRGFKFVLGGASIYRIYNYFDVARQAERAVAHYAGIVETTDDARAMRNAATVALGAYRAARTAFDDAEWPEVGDGWGYNTEMQREEERLDELFRTVDRLTDAANEKTGWQVNFFENFWG